MAGQDAAAFFGILPEMTVTPVDWLVGDRRDGGEFGLLRDGFVLLGWRGILGHLPDGVFGVDAELNAGGVFYGDVEGADDQTGAFDVDGYCA